MTEIPVNPEANGSHQTQNSAPPPFQPVASAYQPVSAPGQPVAPPVKTGGSSALKIVLIIVGVFVFLAVLVVAVIGYGVYRVRKAIHVNNETGAMTANMPGFAMNADSGMKFSASELGTEIYPGAEPSKSGNMRMNLGGSAIVSATFLTSDPKEKVIDFYKSKLGEGSTSMEFGHNAILSAKQSDHDQVSVTVSQQANEFNGRTQIHIQHTTVAQTK